MLIICLYNKSFVYLLPSSMIHMLVWSFLLFLPATCTFILSVAAIYCLPCFVSLIIIIIVQIHIAAHNGIIIHDHSMSFTLMLFSALLPWSMMFLIWFYDPSNHECDEKNPILFDYNANIKPSSLCQCSCTIFTTTFSHIVPSNLQCVSIWTKITCEMPQTVRNW